MLKTNIDGDAHDYSWVWTLASGLLRNGFATGFLNEEGTWDVYFDKRIEDETGEFFKNYKKDELGVLLFTAKDYDEADLKFAEWVRKDY